MTSIPLLVEAIEFTQFRCIYLKKEKIFSEFFSEFFESALKFEHFQKKMTLIAYVFQNYRPRKTCLDKCLKAPVSENPLTGDMLSGPKH